MGCISDAVLFGSFRASAHLGAGDRRGAARQPGHSMLPGWSTSAAPATGSRAYSGSARCSAACMFGFGMVLAGGCASRNLVRLGGGSLKALMTLLVMGVAAYATTLGVLTPLHRGAARGRDRRCSVAGCRGRWSAGAVGGAVTGLGRGLVGGGRDPGHRCAVARVLLARRELPARRRSRDRLGAGCAGAGGLAGHRLAGGRSIRAGSRRVARRSSRQLRAACTI